MVAGGDALRGDWILAINATMKAASLMSRGDGTARSGTMAVGAVARRPAGGSVHSVGMSA